MRVRTVGYLLASLVLAFLSSVSLAKAADNASIRGTVVDPLGGVIVGAKVEALLDGGSTMETLSDNRGRFEFQGLPEGRYVVTANAAGFERTQVDVVALAGQRATANVTLQIGSLRQDVVVTASASGVSAAQVGAPVTVLDAASLEQLGNTEILDPIRTVPGVAVVQVGQRGGQTGLFVRGGSSNFNKVLVDGMSVTEIGGAFDFANFATSGVERLEVLRGSNSVAYGSDAMTGVVDIATARGRSRRPEAFVAGDVGNLGTSHADLSMGGTARQFDYFASYGRIQTDNSVPNSKYDNSTVSARAGMRVGSRTDVSATLRWFDADAGSPNAFNHYGVADDAQTATSVMLGTVTARAQMSDRWQGTLRFGATNREYTYENPTATGVASDSSAFANYLGNVVTITAPNGRSVTGRAILDFGGTYPSRYVATGARQLFVGQTGFQLTPAINVAGGVRIEHEHGTSNSGTLTETTRNNYGGFVEGRGSLRERMFVTAGVGVDRNEVFGNAVTPRVSVAAYLRPPSGGAMLSDTKVTLNAGKGIKAPSLDQELSSVFGLLPSAVSAAVGVEPVGAERSRTFDVGVEQGLARGRARVRVAYFNNEFDGLIEYISKSVLPQLGVSPAVANALAFGAYANAQSNRASGLEMSGNAAVGDVSLSLSYMYLDAEVTRSLSSGALFPMSNPAFPGIQIGQYSPLVGNRPFRRPANSGSLVAAYTKARAQLSLAAYFFGQADDSTYLSDPFFGGSMLLPNQNLAAAYQRFDINGSVQVHPRLRWYVMAENAFNQTYEAAKGYPALPRMVRTGVRVLLGGDVRRP